MLVLIMADEIPGQDGLTQINEAIFYRSFPAS